MQAMPAIQGILEQGLPVFLAIPVILEQGPPALLATQVILVQGLPVFLALLGQDLEDTLAGFS